MEVWTDIHVGVRAGVGFAGFVARSGLGGALLLLREEWGGAGEMGWGMDGGSGLSGREWAGGEAVDRACAAEVEDCEAAHLVLFWFSWCVNRYSTAWSLGHRGSRWCWKCRVLDGGKMRR